MKLALNYSFYSGGAALLGRSDNVNKEMCTTSFVSRQSSFLFLWLSGPRRQFPGRESILGKTINKMKCLCIDLIFPQLFLFVFPMAFPNYLRIYYINVQPCLREVQFSPYPSFEKMATKPVFLCRNVCETHTPLPSSNTLAHPPSPGPA